MSSPSRQVGNRRLPPLPSGSRYSPIYQRASNGHGTSPVSQAKAAKGPVSNRTSNSHGQSSHITHIDLTASFGDGPFRPALVQGKAIGNGQDVDEEAVRNFLRANPVFLEDYVMKYVDQDRLERWLIRKTRKLKNKVGKKPASSLDHDNNKQSDPHRPSLSKWKFCVHSEKKKMLEELTNDIHQSPNKQKVLMELANCIASACHADSFTLYLVDATGKALFIYNPNHPEGRTSSNIQIKDGSTIAAFVAFTQKPFRTNEVLGDYRFPEGIGLEDSTAQSVLCQPIIQSNGELIGVIELCRRLGHEAFGEEDDEIVNSYLVWGGISLYYAEMFQNMQRHRKLTEFLLNVTRSIFQDIVSMDTVIMKIMNYAQTLVDADRTSLFLVDNRTNELYARIFDIGGSLEDSRSSNLQKEIRFPKTKGVAGHVATTGETLNIADAYHDERFNREIDLQTGYTTTTLLCMPIFIRGNIIGVVQMVNKKSGVFTASDEKSFQTFAIYCGLALHHAKLYDKIRRSEQKHRVALEVLSYHSKCSERELTNSQEMPVQEPFPSLESYKFDSYSLVRDGTDFMPSLVIQMTKNLFSLQRFGVDELWRFVLTVKKNYRDVPYHNWTHAFAVAHSMYLVIRSGNEKFTALEALAMFFASLCHDLDHRGRTNSWMKNEQTPLAAVYSTSTMEHHHFNQTITILQHEGHNIFSHLSPAEYKTVLGYMKECILATDLALFFGNKSKLNDMVEKGQFTWDNQEHRKLLRAICMTACDLSACTKPWEIQLEIVRVIYQEFYAEGDLEKAQGKTPIAMKDRNTAHELPAHQVGFLVGICLPCYELLQKCIPDTKPLVEGSQAKLTKWSRMAQHNRNAIESMNPPSDDSSKEDQEENEEKSSEAGEKEGEREEKKTSGSDEKEKGAAETRDNQSDKKEEAKEEKGGKDESKLVEGAAEESNEGNASP
ncbi:probable 3',5'-cyclic phosphodiesterase pde-5 [Stylophora pistillata]|uniref:Putative 3',5'-cyclic phosphodiesterase pde-5 n=1 Tax=Stylophora pistillata TaxID=50429 RepID=A0A2B4RJR5_STYPI|nr:probable 3',5'-cyclic phosphodiesterase pde-5 [Stylophora pistillata]PFX17416.1 putative 3',5'-cyclic phosphodiesterase pde-5 [Stylophora pistillata]